MTIDGLIKILEGVRSVVGPDTPAEVVMEYLGDNGDGPIRLFAVGVIRSVEVNFEDATVTSVSLNGVDH